jgi:hypothetical protein
MRRKRLVLAVGIAAAVCLAGAGGLAIAAGSSTSLDNNVNEAAGYVKADGTCGACVDPFTVQHPSTGEYRIIYPAKTWNHANSLPIPTVTPFNGEDVRGRVIGLGFFADGSLTFRAQFVDASGTPTDTGWFFTVTQP